MYAIVVSIYIHYLFQMYATLKKGEIQNILPCCELTVLSVGKLHFIWLDKKTIFLGDLSFLMRHYFVPEKSTQMLFSNFSCMFLNPNIFFQFELY